MRWFKHFSDNHRGQGIQALLYEKGHTGVCVYYFLMELCADKMEKYEDGTWPTKFRFSRSILRSILKINRTNLQHILDYCQTLGLLKLGDCDDHFVEIEMPIFLKLLDRDFKKTRHIRAQNAQKSRLDIEEDKDIDKEEEYIAPRCKQVASRLPKSTFPFSDYSPKDEIKERWITLYGDDYLNREFIKIANWLDANPKKNRRNEKGWPQFISNWLERGWSSHLSKIESAPEQRKSFIEENNDRVKRELEKKYGVELS